MSSHQGIIKNEQTLAHKLYVVLPKWEAGNYLLPLHHVVLKFFCLSFYCGSIWFSLEKDLTTHSCMSEATPDLGLEMRFTGY